MGSHICRYLVQQGHIVNAYYLRLPNESFIEKMRKFQPTVLIHCAGSSSVSDSLLDPYADFQKTLGVTAFILDSIRKVNPECKIIFPSSAAVYGNPKILPIPESESSSPISPYGFHKMLSEKLIEEFSLIYGISFSILRIFSAYGEGLLKQAMYDLCKKFTDKRTDYVEVYGTGSESRDFIHVADICKAFDYMIKPEVTGIYNLASGKQTRVSDLVELIKGHFNSSKSVQYTGKVRSGDPINWEADIKKISKTGFSITIPLQTGVKQYCDWFLFRSSNN